MRQYDQRCPDDKCARYNPSLSLLRNSELLWILRRGQSSRVSPVAFYHRIFEWHQHRNQPVLNMARQYRWFNGVELSSDTMRRRRHGFSNNAERAEPDQYFRGRTWLPNPG